MIWCCVARFRQAERYRSRQRSQARRSAGRGRQHVVQPVVGVPVGGFDASSPDDLPCLVAGAALGNVAVDRIADAPLELEPRRIAVELKEVRQRRLRSRFVSASQIAWTWARTRSSFVRSSRGGRTWPATICAGRRKKYWSCGLPGRSS